VEVEIIYDQPTYFSFLGFQENCALGQSNYWIFPFLENVGEGKSSDCLKRVRIVSSEWWTDLGDKDGGDILGTDWPSPKELLKGFVDVFAQA
jgi:hypothetical protein